MPEVTGLIWFVRFAFIVISAGTGWCAWQFRKFYTGPKMRAIIAMATLYPIGKTLGLWVIGPRWVRWYLGDVGFIAFTALLFLHSTWLKIPPPARFRFGARFGLVAALTVEALMLSAKQLPNYPKHKFWAAGDWTDALIFVLTYFVVMTLIRKIQRAPEGKDSRGRKIKRKDKRRRNK